MHRDQERRHPNTAELELELSAEQVKRLDEASRIELGFPESMYANRAREAPN